MEVLFIVASSRDAVNFVGESAMHVEIKMFAVVIGVSREFLGFVKIGRIGNILFNFQYIFAKFG